MDKITKHHLGIFFISIPYILIFLLVIYLTGWSGIIGVILGMLLGGCIFLGTYLL